MLTFKFSGADGVMQIAETLTTGMVGKKVKFEFTSDWDGLKKTAVFLAGENTWVIEDVDTETFIPAQVLVEPKQRLYVGIYGYLEDGTVIIPTIMVKGPRIEQGADPEGAPALDPENHAWIKSLPAAGWAPDMYLGTDALGNVVTKEVDLDKASSKLLIEILRSGIYEADVSAKITALEEALQSNYSGETEISVPVATAFMQGAVSYASGKMQVNGSNTARATLCPIGQYLTKGATYSIGLYDEAAATYNFGILVFVASDAGLEFEHVEGADEYYDTVTSCPIDSGWLGSAYDFTATEDNMVLAMNVKRLDGAAMSETDYEALLAYFIVEVG